MTNLRCFLVAGFAARLNAKLNTVNNSQLITSSEDLIASAGRGGGCGGRTGTIKDGTREFEADVILIGDLFYDERMAAETLRPWLKCLADSGKLVLIGDPGRHGLTPVLQEETTLQLLASYPLTDNCCLENNGFQEANVWKFSTININSMLQKPLTTNNNRPTHSSSSSSPPLSSQ